MYATSQSSAPRTALRRRLRRHHREARWLRRVCLLVLGTELVALAALLVLRGTLRLPF